jgi:hypothetical protein
MMATSFLSEHSAEFVLVPQLIRILSDSYEGITPFYFWAGREGSLISKCCDTGESIRMVAVYARRPKISSYNDYEITVKFNAVLSEKAYEFSKVGIPVLAGVPRVTSIMDFRLEAKCSWFQILSDGEPADIEGILNIDDESSIKIPVNNFVRGPLSESAINSLMIQQCNQMKWVEAIDVIRTVRASRPRNYLDYSSYLARMFGGYKPFFLILRQPIV